MPVARPAMTRSVTRLVVRPGTQPVTRFMARFARWMLRVGAAWACMGGGAFAHAGDGCGWAAQVPAEQGMACQAAAQSADGHWLAVAGGAPPTLRVYAVQPGEPVHGAPEPGRPTHVLAATHPVAMLTGQVAAGVHAVFSSPHRRSLVVGLDGLPELWEINLDPAAEPIHDGYVHDYRMGEAIAKRGFLGVRRTPLPQPVRVLGTDAPGTHVFTVPVNGPLRIEVVNLDVRRPIATLRVPNGVQVHTAQLRVCQGTPAVVLGLLAAGQPWAVIARAPWPDTRDCDD